MPRLNPESPAAADQNRRADRAAFPSVVFERSQDRNVTQDTVAPDFFVDLNLDQIVEAATAGLGRIEAILPFSPAAHRVCAPAVRRVLLADPRQAVGQRLPTATSATDGAVRPNDVN